MKDSSYKEKLRTWAWNDHFSVGQRVKAVVSGKEVLTVTASLARRADGRAVIDLEGVDGPVLLRQVQAVGLLASKPDALEPQSMSPERSA